MRAIIDSGPLIALFDRDDSFHERAVAFMREFRGSLVTTLPVLTEVSHLLDFNGQVQRDFLRWVRDGAVQLVDVTADDLSRLCELTEKYADRPMDFADGTLVLIAERTGIKAVVSLDSDFDIYRLKSGKPLENLFKR